MSNGNMKTKVTIVMATYNCAEQISYALNSIVSQDYKNIELVVIDGCSTDGTLDILHQYSEYISILKSEPDNGIYDAMNKGIGFATGDIIGFLGSDDVYFPGAISSIVQGFNESNADLVYGNIIFRKSSGDEYLDYKNLDFNEYFYRNILCHQALFVRTALQKAMPFDLSYCIAADYKFLMILYFAGFKFHHVEKDIAIYNGTGNSGSHAYWAGREFQRAVDEIFRQFPQLNYKIKDVIAYRHKIYCLKLQDRLFRSFRQSNKRIAIEPKRELIIFGSGRIGHECLSILRKNINFGEVRCFWDNDKAKQGQSIEDVPISKPFTCVAGQLIIVATNDYDQEMCQQLDAAGMVRGIDYWGWEDWLKNLFLIYWQGLLGQRGKKKRIKREIYSTIDKINLLIKCIIIS